MYILGIDIGGTFTRTGFVDNDYNISNFRKIETKEVISDNYGIDKFLNMIDVVIKESQLFDKSFESLKAISIGVPATINKEKNKIISATYLHSLENVDLVEVIKSKFGNIEVFLEKDVNFLLYKDMYDMQLYNYPIVCGVYFGTGIGNSIYINNEFISGKHGTAGELGHIPVYGNDRVCGCGNIGCIESKASGKALQYINDEKYKNNDISEIFKHYNEDKELKDFIYVLSMAVATEVNILDPDIFIFGGGLQDMNNFPRKELEECIYKHSRKPYPGKDIKILYTRNTQMSGVIGGGIYAFDKLKNNKIANNKLK
ncbi:allose kinase [uncultured Brachyspira sp.]|uniref:allose kinase n=1 Tax=uncultured Brachyspira sp. TaxID=221953 RepID=UPI002594E507|nr:allose kinase [uncultured Brachyspira sp.]